MDTGIFTFCPYDTCKPVIKNSVIIIRETNSDYTNGIDNFHGGQPKILNNIIIGNGKYSGVEVINPVRSISMKNNLISGFWRGYENGAGVIDTTYVVNNIFRDQTSNNSTDASISFPNRRAYIRNNIISNSEKGIQTDATLNSDFNLFWNNEVNANNGSAFGENDLFVDPMFLKDTTANSFAYDYHLQKYSPAIDAGDPNILDVDGTRSDIGIFGGPLGQRYTYQDIAPRNPVNVAAEYKDGLIQLKWNKNTEADFYQYRIYRDTVSGFIITPATLSASVSDSFYNDNVSNLSANSYYYKITAVDSAGNGSAPSEEIEVVITGLGEMPPKIIEGYQLMQNYPNPFNPSTTIGYRLKEAGHVRLIIYNIIAEKVAVLVDSYQEKGYHEAVFTSKKEYLAGMEGMGDGWNTGYGDIVSGIYLYRIEVRGSGRMPVYSGMNKMILVK